MIRPHRRRFKNYILDARFQLKWAVALALAGGLIFGAMSVLLYEKARANTALLGLDAVDPFDQAMGERLAAADGPLAWQLAGFCAVLMLVLFVIGVLATHRIAGPLHVVEQSLRALAVGGRIAPRALRDGDEFQALFAEVRALGEALAAERSASAATRQTLQQLQRRLAQASETVERAEIEAWLAAALGDAPESGRG